MRNWHFQASLDVERQPEIRRWHRRQVAFINQRLAGQSGPKMPLMKVAMIEFLAGLYRESLLTAADHPEPFNWEKRCQEAMEEVLRRGGHLP